MERLNKAAAVGVVFFSVMLAGFVGMKVDQTTVALLGGAFIGLVVAVPTTALIMIVGLRKPDADQVKTPPPAQPPPIIEVQGTPPVANFYYYQNTINVYTSRRGLSRFDECTEVATALNVSRYKAEQMIESGEVKLLPPPAK